MSRLYNILNTLVSRTRSIDTGRYVMTPVTKQTYEDVYIDFHITFPTTPRVVVGLESASTGYGMGMISVAATNISTTGFTLRVFNADTTASSRTPAVNWLAIEPKE